MKIKLRLVHLSLAINLLLFIALTVHPGAAVNLAVLVCVSVASFAVGVAAFIMGRLTAGSPNARSLAQRNRHLNRKLDATQAKLEWKQARDG